MTISTSTSFCLSTSVFLLSSPTPVQTSVNHRQHPIPYIEHLQNLASEWIWKYLWCAMNHHSSSLPSFRASSFYFLELFSCLWFVSKSSVDVVIISINNPTNEWSCTFGHAINIKIDTRLMWFNYRECILDLISPSSYKHCIWSICEGSNFRLMSVLPLSLESGWNYENENERTSSELLSVLTLVWL